MSYIELPKEACFKPIYSPRTTLSRHNEEMDKLTTNLAINIDKYILGFFKDAFENNNQELSLNEFMATGIKHMKSWQRDLKDRDQKLYECLEKLFEETDSNNRGIITWNSFNGMLIEKGLNLKSLRNQQPGNTALMKSVSMTGYNEKHNIPIQKMVNLGNKIALFHEESNRIDFLSTDGSRNTFKSLVLNQQQLIVKTTTTKRSKQGRKQLQQKDVIVADYKNVLLDMIYIDDSKYNMLITSSSDFIIRGWDVSGNACALAKQPENEDQKMEHQFPTEIYVMAWDNINEVLYCCGKTPRIYEWMVKTDSQRQLVDLEGNGHTEMISAMIMMPKLQFLATGGYDGKLILWDTISQTKKFNYTGHTRSISSMTFHEGLILLFSAAYDHSICVWNPYIQSLIHKIINNVNFIQLGIIPDTNLLIALDSCSNVKIRQINKFTLVSHFLIDKHEHKIEPTTMIATNEPLRYYFAGLGIAAFEYTHIDTNAIADFTALSLKYVAQRFQLYCPIKNNVVIWDLLTGTISNILRNLTSTQITAYDIIYQLSLTVVGDLQGNVVLHKLDNGMAIKKIYKHKLNVTIVKADGNKHEKMIFSASYDGEINIFARDNNNEFNSIRKINLKKLNAQSHVSAFEFQSNRNTLIIGTNLGQVYFLDIDKNKIVSKCQSKGGEIQSLVQLKDECILLCFSKKSQIFGIYLSPHVKKFKPSCHLVSEQASKITCAVMCMRNKRCYIGCENGDLMCFWLNQQIITDKKLNSNEDASTSIIKHIWKVNFAENIRNINLIESQDLLVAIIGANSISLISCEDGFQIAQLNQKTSQLIEPRPILFLDQDKNAIYAKSHDKFLPLSNEHSEAIKRTIDPSYYLKIAETSLGKFNTVSNPNWKFFPKIEAQVDENLRKATQRLNSISDYEKRVKKPVLVKGESASTFKISEALQIQKRWQGQKEQQQSKSNSFHNKSWIKLKKEKGESLHNSSQAKFKQTEINFENTNPLYRLGIALRSINDKDAKALKLIEMGEKDIGKSKSNVRLPKIKQKQV